MRKHTILAATAIGAAAIAGCGGKDGGTKSTSSSSAQTTTASSPATPSGPAKAAIDVSISNFTFLPPTVTVKKGGTITWTNKDSAEHTATASGSAPFDTGALQKGDSKGVTFSKPGTYAYVCSFHPFMKGTVVVQ